MRIVVTGVAGFIGMHVAMRLLADGHQVIGIDNMNAYYDVRLKQARLKNIGGKDRFRFQNMDIATGKAVANLFAEHKPEIVVHLAAQAGVRHSLENPGSYIDSNLLGFSHVLEACRHHDVQHLVYASSSSVYGLNENMPFEEGQNANHSLSLYGATKKANELLAHSYAHLFGLPTTGLRFFTVYGPWGRPDMAPMLFADAITTGQPIKVFNNGAMERDFTYIDDIVEGVVRVAMKPAEPDSKFDPSKPDAGTSNCAWRIFNISNSQPIRLMDFINELEARLGIEAKKNFMEMQQGDMVKTFADTTRLREWVGFEPHTSLREGMMAFVSWYKDYNQP